MSLYRSFFNAAKTIGRAQGKSIIESGESSGQPDEGATRDLPHYNIYGMVAIPASFQDDIYRLYVREVVHLPLDKSRGNNEETNDIYIGKFSEREVVLIQGLYGHFLNSVTRHKSAQRFGTQEISFEERQEIYRVNITAFLKAPQNYADLWNAISYDKDRRKNILMAMRELDHAPRPLPTSQWVGLAASVIK